MESSDPALRPPHAQPIGWPVSVSVDPAFNAIFVLNEVKTGDVQVTAVNDAGEALLGQKRDDLLNKPFRQVFAESPLAGDFDRILDLLQTQTPYHEDRIHRNRLYSIQFTPTGDAVFANVSDITDRIKAKRVLAANQAFAEKLTGSLPEFVYVIDPEETAVTFRNRDFLAQLGYPSDTAGLGLLSLCDLVHPDDRSGFCDHKQHALTSRDEEVVETTCRICSAAGDWKWFQFRSSVFARNEEGQPKEILRTIQDVSEHIRIEIELREKIRLLRVAQFELQERQEQLQNLNQQLAGLATTDGLTTLYNFRAFHDKLDEEIRRARRYGIPLAIVLADVDDFKAYNDRYGHPAGDERLRQFARFLKTCSRDSDFLARYGGEEFAMILTNTDVAGAAVYAQGIVDRLNEDDDAKKITASFGCVDLESTDGTKEDLISHADQCLYSAKHQGKNRVVWSTKQPKLVRIPS